MPLLNDGGYGYATAALNVASAGFNVDRCSPAQNAWQKLTVEYNRFASVPADNCKMYLNGTKVNDSGWTTYGMPPFINGIFNVGARQGGSYYFNGKIDNLTDRGHHATAACAPTSHQTVHPRGTVERSGAIRVQQPAPG